MKKKDREPYLALSFGQYFPGKSVLHRLDPRLKLVLGILLLCVTLLARDIISFSLLLCGILAGIVLVNLPLKLFLIPLRTVSPFIVLVVLLQIFTVPQSGENTTILWRYRFLVITDLALYRSVLLVFRFIIILMGITFLSSITSVNQLTGGVEQLFRPLRRLGIPAHEFSLMITISIRFVQILLWDVERIIKAQISRGADFNTGGFGIFKNVRRMFPLIIPIFIVSLDHAHRLIEAMESRCYMGGRGRTFYHSYRYSKMDYMGMIFIGVIIWIIIILEKLHIGRFIWNG